MKRRKWNINKEYKPKPAEINGVPWWKADPELRDAEIDAEQERRSNA